MIHQMNIYGKDKVQVAIERFKTFEPKEGYYLAFSGGKDSCVIKALADLAGVKYDAHYNITSVDPPELVYFIRKHHPDVAMDRPRDKDGKVITMWNLIPHKGMPPTRVMRYCCHSLKESQGNGRFIVTGVRKAESSKRASRGGLEVSDMKTGPREKYDVDNNEEWMVRTCMQKRQRILNPIIDWSADEVWEFIREYTVPYCELYDQGKTRLGCLGCPMQGSKGMIRDFELYPKYKALYLNAFDKMLVENDRKGLDHRWKNGQEVMDWWCGFVDTPPKSMI